MARWACRLFRREWRQQLLVLALITVAVAATILGAGIATNTPPPAGAAFGGAQYAITLPGSDPHLAADIASITSHISAAPAAHRKTRRGTPPATSVQVVEEENLTTGSVNPVGLRAEDPNGPFGHSTISLIAGRYPAAAGQVALPRAASGRSLAWWRTPATCSLSSPSSPPGSSRPRILSPSFSTPRPQAWPPSPSPGRRRCRRRRRRRAGSARR